MLKNRRYICIFLVILLCFSFFGCTRKSKSADSFLMRYSDDSVNVSAENVNTDIFCDGAVLKELKKISDTDMAVLYFNETKGSISVYDSGSDKLWRSLPEKYRNEKTGILAVTVLVSGNEYTLFSQEGQSSFEIKENSILITCDFSSSTENGGEIGYRIPVEFKGADGTMTAEIDCGNIVSTAKNKNAVLKSISVLPFFGAFYAGNDGDFILVPDGSGALIDASSASGSKEGYTVDVYGSDPSENEAEGSYAIIPAFGVKNGNSAIAAVIDEGAAIARINAEAAAKKEGFNRVYPEFEITPTAKNDDGSYYVSENSYKGRIKTSYRFLSKDSADYIGIAGACRELFIRNGALTSGNTDADSEYPFNLSLIGLSGITDENGNTKMQVLCDYTQTYDILESLKAKDINSINLRYRGILEGGVLQKETSDFSFASALGGKQELKELSDYASKGNVSIFTDVNLFSADAESGFKNYAVSLRGDSTVMQRNGSLSFELSSVNDITENTKSMLSAVRENEFEGICLSDAGSVLYSDFSSDEVKFRTDTADIIYSQMGAVSAAKRLMVERGNLYSVKYASLITGLPEKAFYGDKEGVSEVPFVQAILHGIADYSLSAINTSQNSVDAFLKCVEYGAIPYYEWYYSNLGTEQEPDKYYYMNSVAEAQIGYERMKAAFSDLRNERITDHREVRKNVFLTEYGGSTKVYVNYNDKAVTVSGVKLDAKSFLRMN
ncbi:MAG: hypothetical protein IJ491_02590 [Clostridia bacterium]|nr:hypothetical protein [Clostridia bacterium]